MLNLKKNLFLFAFHASSCHRKAANGFTLEVVCEMVWISIKRHIAL